MEQDNKLDVFKDSKKQKNVRRAFTNYKKRATRGIFIDEEDLDYNCECEGCSFSSYRYYDFQKHLEAHVDESIDCIELESTFRCEWENCDFIGQNLNYLKVHLTFHGYHTRLKSIGSKLLLKMNLPDCTESEISIPKMPAYYACEWESCSLVLFNYQCFIDHAKCHINALPKKASSKEESIRCRWNGCSNTYPLQYKLLDHLRSHTKEKTVACPTCGMTFSCRTKFIDHRKRQLSTDLRYQCSQCSKLFASERLLRDHMRIHINHYKCHLCDMTCAKPSTLAKHIRYRHLPERLFKCDMCSHSTITQQDLGRHRATHNQSKQRECKTCGYKCRSKYIMEKHIKQHAGTWVKKYACHCCDKRFSMGSLLTKHLIKVHDFHWPSGHSRFSYKEDPKTGLYHLQVVRYESLEVTQEMMEDQIPYPVEGVEDCKYDLIQNKPCSFILQVTNKECPVKSVSNTEAENKSVCKRKNIKNEIIAIKDINMIKTESVDNEMKCVI